MPIADTRPVVPPAYCGVPLDAEPPAPWPALITVGVPAMPPPAPTPVARPDTATCWPPTVTRSLELIVPSPEVSNGLDTKRPPVMLSSTMRKLWPPEAQLAVDGSSVVKISRPLISVGWNTARSPVLGEIAGGVSAGKSRNQPLCSGGDVV